MPPARMTAAEPTDAAELNTFLPDGQGFRRNKHLYGLLNDETGVTHVVYDAILPANSGYEIFRRLWPRLNHSKFSLGYWSIVVHYDRLLHIPDMSVSTYQKIAQAIREGIEARSESPFVVAADVINKNFSKSTWSALNEVMLREIRRDLDQWARTTREPRAVINFPSIDEADGLVRRLDNFGDGNLTHRILGSLVDHMFGLEPKNLIRQKYPRTGSGPANIKAVIGPGDSAIADLMSCSAIDIDMDAHPGLDKFNALLLPQEDREKVFNEIFESCTVVRMPDSIVIQNVYTDDVPWLEPYDIDVFGVTDNRENPIANEIRRARTIYGVKPDTPPSMHLARYTPVNMVQGDFYMTTLRGIPVL